MVAHLLDDQPEDVQELFRYALGMLMIEDGKAKLVETHRVDHLAYPTVETATGDGFDILKRQMSADLLGKMRTLAREILEQDRETGEE